jgi:hypothetical protein
MNAFEAFARDLEEKLKSINSNEIKAAFERAGAEFDVINQIKCALFIGNYINEDGDDIICADFVESVLREAPKAIKITIFSSPRGNTLPFYFRRSHVYINKMLSVYYKYWNFLRSRPEKTFYLRIEKI